VGEAATALATLWSGVAVTARREVEVASPFGRRGWTPERLGDLSGRRILITGANSGIGFEASRVLAGKGAQLLWICRNPEKAEAAARALRQEHPRVQLTTFIADLSDLDTVRTAADDVADAVDGLDAVINNAGIMMVPERKLTAQGFELQLGVNHLAHFALNAWLFELVEAAGGRLVAVSSGAHKAGGFDFDDLMWEEGYGPVKAYCRSKLANLLFVREACRRLEAAGSSVRAYATHPGYADTNLQTTGPSSLWGKVMGVTNKLVAQSAERGGWPLVLAAVDEAARPGAYYGPTGLFESRGPVGECEPDERAHDDAVARRLWTASEELTGATFPL